MGLITIKTYDNLIDAHLLCATLESRGIESFLFDQEIIGMNPLYNLAVGGIKVKVNLLELEKTGLILKELDEKPYTDDDNRVISCPTCESFNLISGFKSFKNLRGIFALSVAFLFVLYPPYYKNVYKCRECGCEFDPIRTNTTQTKKS